MPAVPLKYLSEQTLIDLRENIPDNRDRYMAGDFLDLERENGWRIELDSVTVDLDLLSELDGETGGTAAEVANSLVVYRALKGMTPALAREERIWARLTHVECLEYSRKRWLGGNTDEALDASVGKHFFARTLTETRDDNAIARLWWNARVAEMAAPDSPEAALNTILKTADIRSNFVERSRMVMRQPVAKAVLRIMEEESWLTATERAFRDFMVTLNREGGGILFEVLAEDEVDSFIRDCLSKAKREALGA
ncbi:hypothetical protein DES49_2676 [Halospina denitrificans]|uniref:Uncharacterized protein n=1 Tax=Halospina denitrificans TaxID=332522 RepID=A0A4V3EPF5_9GAMM|nr:DUF6339 family protein [Halospina denitrificans]TDT37718.1 hypothetical protein DES49_2676 [Halospina denitrificans]